MNLMENHFAIRTDLLSSIQNMIQKRKLTHEETSKITGIGRTVITNLMNNNPKKVSTDRLIRIAESLGLKVKLSVSESSRR